MFTYSHANSRLSQAERAYYLSYFINGYVWLCRTMCGYVLLCRLKVKLCVFLVKVQRLGAVGDALVASGKI